MSGYLPRAMTSPELSLIRSDGQFSNLYLAILKPATVYTALVNQTFTTQDMIAQVTYDTGSGTLGNVLPGMTMYVSAIGYGKYELGQCRIRKTPSGTDFYIGEGSEIAWANRLYLTVVDEFNLWARHIKLDVNNVAYMDYDIAYTDQHLTLNPVPVLGPRLIPVWLSSGTVIIPFDATDSWCIGSYVNAWNWTAAGASSSSGMATSTPTITYNAAGTYRVDCVVTAFNGKTTTGHAYVMVFDDAHPPITQFEFKGASGSWSGGGWTTKVLMYAEADSSLVVDRAQCVLFAKDYYGTTLQSISPVTGRENIITSGWINSETIEINPDGSSVEFTFASANSWLDKLPGFPVGLQNVALADAWTNFGQLTVDKSLYHLFYWQSTVIPVIDVYLTGDTKLSAEQSVPGEMSLWQQISYLATNTLLAKGISDRYSRLFVEVDADLTSVTDRSTIPVVMTLGYTDWRDKAQIIQYIVPPTGKIAASGVAIDVNSIPLAYFALSPGHVFKRHGKSGKQDRLLLKDQSHLNETTGMLVGKDNRRLDFVFDLAGNNRMVDIAPKQFVTFNVVAGDSPIGFTYSGHVIIREIAISFSSGSNGKDDNFLQITWHAEQETFPELSTNGDIPLSPPNSIIPPIPPLPPPPPPPVITGDLSANVAVVTNNGIFFTNNFNDTLPVKWYSWNTGLNPANIQYIFNFDVSKISGRGFLHLYTYGGIGEVWSSAGFGQPWYLVKGGAEPAAYVMGMGINRMAADELMITFNIRGQTAKFFYGSSAGVSAAGAVGSDQCMIAHQITYGSGKWVTDFWAGYTAGRGLLRVNRNGSALEMERAVNNLAGDVKNCGRAGVDSPVLFIWNGLSGMTIGKSTDNGSSLSAITTPTGFISNYYEPFGASPDGMYLMAGAPTTPQKSSDGGATWGPAGLSGQYLSFLNLGTNNNWIAGSGNNIVSSTDFGASWVDRTGDLSLIQTITPWFLSIIRSSL